MTRDEYISALRTLYIAANNSDAEEGLKPGWMNGDECGTHCSLYDVIAQDMDLGENWLEGDVKDAKTVKFGFHWEQDFIDHDGSNGSANTIEPTPQYPGSDSSDEGWWAMCVVEPEAGWVGPFKTRKEAKHVANSELAFSFWVNGMQENGEKYTDYIIAKEEHIAEKGNRDFPSFDEWSGKVNPRDAADAKAQARHDNDTNDLY